MPSIKSSKPSTAAAVSLQVATVNVGVQAPSPSVNVDMVVVPSPSSPTPEESSPLSPAADDKDSQSPATRELLLGPDLPSSLDSKQTRAYERERHLVKKLATTTKIKLQKAKSRQAWTQSVLYTMNNSSTMTEEGVVKSSFSPLSAGIHSLVFGEKERLLRDEDYDTLDGIVVETTATGPAGTPTIRDHKREVKLADLISTANTKRGRRRADSDFEVIPHIRSVIVLDDITAHDLAIEEPWEHIQQGDLASELTPATKAPPLSYAKIVASTVRLDL